MKRLLFKFGGEAVLIVVSVFVAILLESMWQDHREAQDARESLAQVRLSLMEDREFFDRVEIEQRKTADNLHKLIEWFGEPETLPNDLVQGFFVNYEMPISIWPRRAAWETMVSAGQLQLLRAPELTTRIGDYYEHHLRRIEYNGRQYDDAFVSVWEGDMPQIWDLKEGRLIITDPARLVHFRNRVVQLEEWTQFYIDSVHRNRAVLDELIEDIGLFLGRDNDD